MRSRAFRRHASDAWGVSGEVVAFLGEFRCASASRPSTIRPFQTFHIGHTSPVHQLNFASGQRIRVVFAGDRPLAKLGVEHITSTSPQLELVGIHATAEEFERSSRAFECDVVLVDYSMRGRDDMDGMALLRYLRRTYPSIAAVVLLAQENPVLVRAILARGMTGIVSKFDEVGHIVTAIREARRGVAYLSPAIGRLLAAPGGEGYRRGRWRWCGSMCPG